MAFKWCNRVMKIVYKISKLTAFLVLEMSKSLKSANRIMACELFYSDK